MNASSSSGWLNQVLLVHTGQTSSVVALQQATDGMIGWFGCSCNRFHHAPIPWLAALRFSCRLPCHATVMALGSRGSSFKKPKSKCLWTLDIDPEKEICSTGTDTHTPYRNGIRSWWVRKVEACHSSCDSRLFYLPYPSASTLLPTACSVRCRPLQNRDYMEKVCID